MHRCLISLGANLGDSASAMREAIAALKRGFESVEVSRVYRTPAVGGPGGQDAFLNAVAAVRTRQEVWQAWNTIRDIEREMGRQRQHRWEARRIDLDILLHGESRIWTTDLKVPHPRMCMRKFVLEPAVEVAGDWLDPVSLWTISQLAENLRSASPSVLLLGESTDRSIAIGRHASEKSGGTWLGTNPPVGLPDWSKPWIAADDLCWWRRVTEHTSRSPSAIADLTLHPFFSIVYPVLTASQNHAREADPAIPPPLANSGSASFNAVLEIKASAFSQSHQSRHYLSPRLVVVLADVGDPDRHDWEITVGPWADWLRLRSSDESSILSWNGPRYLLAADDADWASHEVEAAIQAMNCELEVIEHFS